MPDVHDKQNEIKRKLRKLKKLEMKIRLNNIPAPIKNKITSKESQNIELVWNQFFDLKDESSKNVKYSLNKLIQMSKEQFRDVISEYFYYVYYHFYKDTEITDSTFIDVDILSQLGLPINSDIDEVRRKFRELAKIYHPDNGGDSAKFIEIMEKYKRLRN